MSNTTRLQVRNSILPAVILLLAVAVFSLNFYGGFNPQAYLAEGKKAFAAENDVEAIRYFAKAQQYCETDIEARFRLGAAYQRYGWNDEALQQYQITWNLAAINGGRAKHDAGRIMLRKGDPEQAVTYFRQALTLLPKADDIWFDLALTLKQLNRPQSALAAIRQAVRLQPQNQFYKRHFEEMSRAAHKLKQ